MYRCPRLVDVPVVVELPTSMYKTPPFNVMNSVQHANPSCLPPTSSNTTSTTNKITSEASMVEARQEAVLRRLHTLKEQLDRLQSNRTAAAATGSVAASIGAAACASPTKVPGSGIQDLVIRANPSAPPVSLLVLRGALTNAGLPVYSSSRVHSSVTKVDEQLQEAFTHSPLGDRNKHRVAFSVHWTDTPATSLMITPLRQTTIKGEANVIRYISRLFPATSPFNYEATGTFTTIAQADDLMDTAERELTGRGGGGGKTRAEFLRRVATSVSQSGFLCGGGGGCGVVDVVVWSLLRQLGSSRGRLDEAVTRWMAKMDELAGTDLDAILPSQGNKQKQTTTNNKKTTTTTTTTARKEDKGEGGKKETTGGGKHIGRKELEEYLRKLNIPYQVRDHREVFTVEELMKEVTGVPGVVTKNLFLKDKKKKLYLLSTRHNAEIDLKTIAKQAGTKDMRFADEATLLATLGVKQGCVSALALANDTAENLVQFLMDRSAMEQSVPLIHFHPMTNSATLGISPGDLQKFLEAIGHPLTLVTV